MKDELIKDIVKSLDQYNEYKSNNGEDIFDYTGHLAVLEQKLDNKKYKVFLDDLKYADDFFIVDVDDCGDSYYPKITIFFPSYDGHTYEIKFGYDRHSWGYCQCQPTDEGYNVKHGCCGTNCDWYAPLFVINKISSVGQSVFEGLERDLWDFAEKHDKDNKDKKRRELQNEIEELLKTKEAMEVKISNLELALKSI